MAEAGGGYFDRLYRRMLDEGHSPADARLAAFDAYLDGKPQASGKLKPTRHERDSWFWGSDLLGACAPEDWSTEAGTLALARYLSQARVRIGGLVEGVARSAPRALVVAMRRARLVLVPDSPHMPDLRSAAALTPDVEEALKVHDVLVAAHREREVELARCQATVADTTAFELLLLASLLAYEVVVPHSMTGQSFVEEGQGRLDVHWDAINDLLAWKLRDAPLDSLRLDDERMAHSLKRYLSPLLFHDRAPPNELLDSLQAFARLLAAQIELNEFLSRSVDAHCFDDSVRWTDARLDQYIDRGTHHIKSSIDPGHVQGHLALLRHVLHDWAQHLDLNLLRSRIDFSPDDLTSCVGDLVHLPVPSPLSTARMRFVCRLLVRRLALLKDLLDVPAAPPG